MKRWKKTTNRFILFFDIMGFKDLVARNTHQFIYEKLNSLKEELKFLYSKNYDETINSIFKGTGTKSIIFSDSIVFFSRSDTFEDVFKLGLDATWILRQSFLTGLAIKGVLSYGEITVDFKNSLFFGQAIIDAYLLLDQLQMYSVILDNHSEKRINIIDRNSYFKNSILTYPTNFKSGIITHRILTPISKELIDQEIGYVTKLYDNTSGSPRIYIDNTLDWLFKIKQKSE